MATTLLPIDDIDVFVTTRDALHQVAEHVLAKARFVHDREIRLTAFDGGFATPLLPDNTRVRVDGSDLVVDTAGRSARIGLTTIADAAAFVGIIPGFPVELYQPATPFEPDRPLEIDPARPGRWRRGTASPPRFWRSSRRRSPMRLRRR